MTEIYKASAGSGKTYKLSNTYLKRLMESGEDHPYRHILAVTFTNKATAEMKERILSDLDKEAGKGNAEARKFMLEILHDYSAFAVSTIDKFFQRTLKAFSREVGYFSAYQVELDRDSLIAEAMDRILDSLTEDKKELVDWVKRSVAESLEEGERPNIDKALYEMGRMLKSEDHRRLSEEYRIDDRAAYSKERLILIRKECQRAEKDYADRVCEAAKRVTEAMNEAGIDASDTYRGWIAQISRFTDASFVRSGAVPTEAFMRRSTDSSQWFTKANAHLIPAFESRVSGPLDSFCTLFGDSIARKAFCSARLIKEHIFSLGLAGEFYRQYDELLKEKNIMCLDESNVILRDIIDGTDAPFIYEKIGVRFNDFLLDEFQDTSNIQWENFKPLLKESSANGGYSLIVGDVKQSIYRWRDSDWNLLATGVSRDFPDADTHTMPFNWRSCRTIVDFNNSFFPFAANRCDEIAPSDTGMPVSRLYEGLKQEVKAEDPQTGRVQAWFCEDQLQKITEIIDDAHSRGARWSDMAILVRSKNNGAAVAGHLISEGYKVISDDSLNLKSSITVRRLVSLLSCLDNPDDGINSYIARSLDIDYPKEYHSLVDLCEELLRGLGSKTDLSGDTLFIEAFMDELQTWVENNGNDLRQFLKHWQEKEIFIGTPEGADAIRIMTIHKSKGLEFPLVIFPFAEGVKLYHEDRRWCHLETEGSGLDGCMDGIYPINLNSGTSQTLFSHDYDKERKMQIVDNLNVMYVAFTRARKELFVISEAPGKTVKAMSDLLSEYCNGSGEFSMGEPYDYERMTRSAVRKVDTLDAGYPSTGAGGRFKPSADAEDFFGEEGITGPGASPRLCGIVQHDILSRVKVPSDLRASVDEAVIAGEISPEQGNEYFDQLSSALQSHIEFFTEGESFNETSIIGRDGQWYRPDRVVIKGGSVTVIDYKFGPIKDAYRKQVRRYMELYREMGYTDVSGRVWMIPENRMEEIR